MTSPPFVRIAAALLTPADECMPVVRKRGTALFITLSAGAPAA